MLNAVSIRFAISEVDTYSFVGVVGKSNASCFVCNDFNVECNWFIRSFKLDEVLTSLFISGVNCSVNNMLSKLSIHHSPEFGYVELVHRLHS